MVVSGLATLYELQTVYGLEDMADLIEMAMVDAENRRPKDEHY